MEDILIQPVRHIKGVGSSRAALLNRLGLFTVEDVITHFPRDYEDRSRIKSIAALIDGETCAFEGVVAGRVTEYRARKGFVIYRLNVRDDTGTLLVVWYNQPFIRNVFSPGERVVFFGRIVRKYGKTEVQNPVYDKLDSGLMKNTCRIIPVYPSTADLPQSVFRGILSNVLSMVEGGLTETLPDSLRKKYGLDGVEFSIRNIHFPESDDDFMRARKRLVFEELFLLQLGLFRLKSNGAEDRTGICFKAVPEVDAFLSGLPFKLTNAQIRVFHEIERDMESDTIMYRLIQGDVGSGKTLVAVLALFKAAKCGYQGAFMAPTEILAEQHHHTLKAMLEPYGIRIALLRGSQRKIEKERIRQDIASGRVDVVIGTHALIEDEVRFSRLGLVVTDEQHRFGVRQRTALSRKGDHPDVLVMTATPIPRTLALILYGDLDISVIDEMPPGRRPVETYAVDETLRPRIDRFIRKHVAEGRQVYIVCPLVEESGNSTLKAASTTAERIAGVDFADLRVGLLHGRMKPADKDSVMKDFVRHEIDILVATTVIEVGVDVPNATVMVVENAERFGLSQLHQLRGRVGRGGSQSYCILYNKSRSEVTEERMRVLQKTCDGFVISEKDLELRGPGEFFGTRQHGLPELKIANLYRDTDTLRQAQEAVRELLAEDRELVKTEHRMLKKVLANRFDNIPDRFT